MDKLVNIRRYGQCTKCHRYRELRVGWNSLMTDIIAVCDACFDLPMDEEALDLIYEKAGVDGPKRHMVSALSFIERSMNRQVERTFSLEKIFPEDD